MSVFKPTFQKILCGLPLAAIVFSVSIQAKTTSRPAPMPSAAIDITDSEFCQKARFDRDTAIGKEPNLKKIDAVTATDSALCFTPDENLYFVANQEAQDILGPHAPWYLQISKEFRGRVTEACKIMGYENDDISRAYDHCIENRYEELMGPYEDKYRREAGNYVRKRKQVAESLVVRWRCCIEYQTNTPSQGSEIPSGLLRQANQFITYLVPGGKVGRSKVDQENGPIKS